MSDTAQLTDAPSPLKLHLEAVCLDSPHFRACLQRNEDELETLGKWLGNATRQLKAHFDALNRIFTHKYYYEAALKCSFSLIATFFNV